MIADDCPRCWECENVPNSCRWTDGTPTEEQTEEEAEKQEEKPMEIVA
jgi:hypothetical protein